MPGPLETAVKAWNMMDAKIDGQLLELVAEILGVDDIEMLVRQLIVIRDFQRG